MDVNSPLSMLAAAGVWPAVPLTGYLLLTPLRHVFRTGRFPWVTSVAVMTVAGLSAWSVLLLGTALAGVFRAEYQGLIGWGVTGLGLIGLFRSKAAKEATGERVAPVRPLAAADPRGPDTVWNWILAVGLCVAAALYLGFPTESIYGARDEGIYAGHAIYIARHGRVDVPYPWPKDLEATFVDRWDGFPGLYKTQGTMTVQFAYVFPAWLAQAYASFGQNGLFRLNAAFACLSLAVFYGLCRMALPTAYAVVATLFFALNPSQLWMARITLSEVLAQLLIWSGLLLLLEALRSEERPLARWAGVFFGLSAFVRFDGLVLVPLLLLSHLASKMLSPNDPQRGGGSPPHTKAPQPLRDVSGVWRAFYQTALPVFALAFCYYPLFSAPYFREVSELYLRPLVVGTAVCAVLLVASTPRVVKSVRPLLTSQPVLGLVGIGVLTLAAYAYWIRPGLNPPSNTRFVWPGYDLDTSREYGQDSLINLAQYLSAPVVWAAIAGWLLSLWMIVRQGWDHYMVPAVVLVGGCSVLYLWSPGSFPDHFWAIRRFVPVVIPGFVLCAALAASGAFARLPHRWSLAAVSAYAGLSLGIHGQSR